MYSFQFSWGRAAINFWQLKENLQYCSTRFQTSCVGILYLSRIFTFIILKISGSVNTRISMLGTSPSHLFSTLCYVDNFSFSLSVCHHSVKYIWKVDRVETKGNRIHVPLRKRHLSCSDIANFLDLFT